MSSWYPPAPAAAPPPPFVEASAWPKKITREKIFDFEIIGLKYALKHFELIPTKKNFRLKFSDLVIFSLFWPYWPKNDRVPGKNLHGKKFSIS